MSGVVYRVNATAYPDLRNVTRAGDTVSVTFTVTAADGETLSLVGHTAPSARFTEASVRPQAVYCSASRFFAPAPTR